MSSYQALYRVWRPQTFDEMVGQTAIRETLKNAVHTKQITHAYLFTGPRGTGKTSAAKILAKAVNCLNEQAGNPCNECEICQRINEGQLSDIIEIDAASNNGVDEIRNLRDNVRYASSVAKYKVYIIDEVHMLTTGAFNALLKTLEEPPEHVFFILATTEPHKIPATILSRVQRFDFQRISEEDIVERMRYILEHDAIPYAEEALEIIARAANGGMRDSLSLLDQAISFNQEEINVPAALQVSGSLNQEDLINYLLAIYQGNVEEGLQIVRQQLKLGKQTARFIEELILLSRDILLTHYIQSNQTLLSDETIQEILQTIPIDYYYSLINQLNEIQNKIRFTTQPDIYLEVMTVQMAQRLSDASLSGGSDDYIEKEELTQLTKLVRDLEREVQSLQKQLDQYQQQQAANREQLQKLEQTQANQSDEELSQSEMATEDLVPRQRPQRHHPPYKLIVQRIYKILNEATHSDIGRIKPEWSKLIAELDPVTRAKFSDAQPLAASPTQVLIEIASAQYAGEIQNDSKIAAQWRQILSDLYGKEYEPTFILATDWPTVRQQYTALRRQNNNQPISLVESESDDNEHTLEEDRQSEPTDPSGGGPEEESKSHDRVVIEDWRRQAQPAEESESDSADNTNQATAEETNVQEYSDIFGTPYVPEEDENDDEASPDQSGNNLSDDDRWVEQNIDLFGEENVTIHYDK